MQMNYNILFEPDLKAFTFNGKEKITFDADGNRFVLNAAGMTIKSCHIANSGKIQLAKFQLDEKKEELQVLVKEKVKGTTEMHIEFEGVLNDKLAGFYRSKYMLNGREKYLATSQFEAADARRAFPCWDNPEKKATFDISFLIDSKLTAISNMPANGEKKIGAKKLVQFSTTPVMSTYLVYLGVGEFEAIEDKFEGVRIRILTTPGKKEQGRFAMECAKKFLAFYNDYFGIKYPLPKLDFIALPDFASGAMENWGAITFRESGLLYDPGMSSTSTKQYIAEVVSHELAHQWFGDLVTMKWWNDLWLNESFATFMANKSVDSIFPGWDFQNQFLEDSTAVAMGLDALRSTHPIDVDVKSPSEIAQIFDEISYDKGGSILRMLEDFLGEDVFRDGLRNYLSAHKYGNATTDDLWQSLEKISGKPVKKMMDTWVKQAGYPVVTVGNGMLTQQRFLLEPRADRALWHIPLSMQDGSKHLMSEKITLLSTGGMKMNFGQKGFYRVAYPISFIDGLDAHKLPNVDRWGINNDLFALSVAGKFPLRHYLNFVRHYATDDDYIVCRDIEDSLYAIFVLASKEPFWNDVKEYNKAFLSKVFARIGWEPRENEKHTDKLLRTNTLLGLGRTDDDTAAEAGERFQKFLSSPDSLHPDLRTTVYSLAAWTGDGETHSKLTGLYQQAKTQEEKRRFLVGLAGFKDEKLLLKSFDYGLSPDVRLQDGFIPIVAGSGNPYARDIIWPWVRKNWKELSGRYSIAKNLLNRIVDSLGVTPDEKKGVEMRKFFVAHPAKGTEMAIEQMLERLRINARFLENIRLAYGR